MIKNVNGVDVEMTPEEVAAFEADRKVTLPPVESVSARQFRIQLRRAGLLDTVEAWVAQQDGETRDAFEYSGTFVRTEPMMSQGFAAMGFSEDQIDSFFTAAAEI
ncbi:hypothetical protein ACXHXM_01935